MTKSPITNPIARRHCDPGWLIGVMPRLVSSSKFIRELVASGFVDALYKNH
jgi:hypothetical protein